PGLTGPTVIVCHARAPADDLASDPPDLAATLADPDVQPLPGNWLDRSGRIRDSSAVQGHAAARNEAPCFPAGGDQTGLRDDDRRPGGECLRTNREPGRRRV